MEIFRNTSQAEGVKSELKKDLPQAMWDVDVSKLDYEKHYKLIITQVINYGSVDMIKKLFQIYSQEAIIETLKNPIKGVWFPQTYKAFCNLFSIDQNKRAFNILHIKATTKNRVKGIFNRL